MGEGMPLVASQPWGERRWLQPSWGVQGHSVTRSNLRHGIQSGCCPRDDTVGRRLGVHASRINQLRCESRVCVGKSNTTPTWLASRTSAFIHLGSCVRLSTRVIPSFRLQLSRPRWPDRRWHTPDSRHNIMDEKLWTRSRRFQLATHQILSPSFPRVGLDPNPPRPSRLPRK